MKTIIAGRFNRHCSDFQATRDLRKIRELYEQGGKTVQEFKRVEHEVVKLILKELAGAGVWALTDGGIRWDSVFDIARKIEGCSGFTQLTRIPETNHFHRQPRATLPLLRKRSILIDDFIFAESNAPEAQVVLSLPGPYSLARQTENVKELGIETLAMEYAGVLNEEIRDLIFAGVFLVRVEDPQILNHPNDFELFRKVSNVLTANISQSQVVLATWFKDINDFHKYFELPFGVFHLDFVRGARSIKTLSRFPKEKRLIAGIIDAQHTYEDSIPSAHSLIDEILQHVDERRLMLAPNTDLEFLPWKEAVKKVNALVEIARSWKSGTASSPDLNQASAVPVKPSPTFKSAKGTTTSDKPLAFLPKNSFITSAVGSYPQNQEVRVARARLKRDEISREEYHRIIDEHTLSWLAFQDEIELDVPVIGELRRQDMAQFFNELFGGKTLDFVPSYENRRYRPVEFGDYVYPCAHPITVDEFSSAQERTEHLLKATLTGPATLADWALIRKQEYYKDPLKLRMDLARALRGEIKHLLHAGVKIIQIDEPALTTKSAFLDYDIEAIRETIRGYAPYFYFVLHICYSDLEALDSAFPKILELPFHQIHMEMANRGTEMLTLIKRHGFGGKDIGLGVTDVHTDRIESVDEIVNTVEATLRTSHFSPENVWLLPDCGLKERSDTVAKAKLKVMVEAAKICRERFI
ncbi:MAG: hypothetical protein Q8R36_03560 [bacterium]|nr:hypothetical protein [bacterium]